MPLITHIDPPAGEESIAPYNFVPLPDADPVAIFSHPEGEAVTELHNRYDLSRHTGWIELKITTETPLYIRCAYDPGLGDSKAVDTPEKQQFFHHGNPEVPYIPGSSIRGMIRSLVRILSYSKVSSVNDRLLFYRSMEGGVLTKSYIKGNFVTKDPNATDGIHGIHLGYKPKTRAGILRRRAGGYEIEPCEMTRIHRSKIGTSLYYQHPGTHTRTPVWSLRDKTVYVQLEPAAQWHFHPIQHNPKDGRKIHDDMYLWYREVTLLAQTPPATETDWHKGVLVITGDVPRKQMEFVFVQKNGPSVPIDEGLVEMIESPDQQTNWQEKAFEKNQPPGHYRREDGHLRDGEPVFYLTDPANGIVCCLGRAQMFRIPYTHSTLEFVPPTLREPALLDLTDAMFGTVRQGMRGGRAAVKGRVSFEDAGFVMTDENSPFLGGENDGLRSPEVLATPKPTSFQHYLVQTSTRQADRHYNCRPEVEAVIRGDKLYWHKNNVSSTDIFEQNVVSDPQHTIIRPVKAGTLFRGKIHFENLSLVELGALLVACEPGSTKRHKLGMGKPLGMGSVKLEPVLHISDRENRYRTFSGLTEKNEADTAKIKLDSTQAFKDAITKHTCHTGDFWDIPRLRALSALLEWDGAPPHEKTRTIPIEGTDKDTNNRQWRTRRILPTPDGSYFNPNAIPQPNPAHDPHAGTRQPQRQQPGFRRRPTLGGEHVQTPLVKAENYKPRTSGPVKPPSGSKYEQGKRIDVTVLSVKDTDVVVRLPDGAEFAFKDRWFQGKLGSKIKMKIVETNKSGTAIKKLKS